MFDKIRRFALHAMFALIAVMSLGFGLLLAGVAAVIGVLMVVALRIAISGAGHGTRTDPSEEPRSDGAPPQMPQAQPA